MTYKQLKPDESPNDTLKIIKDNYEVYSQRGQNLKELNAGDCEIIKRGQYWLVIHDNAIVHDERHNADYPYFEMALHSMNPSRVQSWKTVHELITFRQAIREATVQGTGYCGMLVENISKYKYDEFMALARAHDDAHHGSPTF